MSVLCSIQNLNLSFGGKNIFENASLAINHNDHIGLIGLNGAGKSSLLKILSEHLSPDNRENQFRFDKCTGSQDPKETYKCFYVPQDVTPEEISDYTVGRFIFYFYPDTKQIFDELQSINHQLEKHSNEATIIKQNNLMLELERANFWDLQNRYQSYLKFFSIENIEQKMANLSGGEQKKVLLAAGLSANASLVLWDEPTNHLDINSIKMFEQELLDSDCAFFIITHDRHLLSRVANKIFHINNKKIESYNGDYTSYLEHIKNKEIERSRLLARLSNTLKRETEWMRQGIKARGCRSKYRVENHSKLLNQVTEIKKNAHKALSLSLGTTSKQSKKLVEAINVSFKHSDHKEILINQSFSIYNGEKIGLIGANGVGKTTILKLICQQLVPTSGQLKIVDNLKIKYFDQRRDSLNPEISPYQFLGNGDDYVTSISGNRQHIITYFEQFNFSKDEIHRPIKTFSGGEKNRLQLAKNLSEQGDILIFDEPTNDLDIETLEKLEAALATFKGPIIVISHDRAFLSNICTKIWYLNDGKIENFNGGYEQVDEYLEAVRIEQDILKEIATDKSNEKNIPKNTSNNKLTNKEKERLKTINAEITKTEHEVETTQEKVAAFDFSTADTKKHEEFASISQTLENLENKLLELYEELEVLQNKS